MKFLSFNPSFSTPFNPFSTLFYYELNQFIKNLPPGQPLAIYWQSGESNLLLKSFTRPGNDIIGDGSLGI